MFVRSLAVVFCAVWLSIDIGIWISETKLSKQSKSIMFSTASCALCCLAMGIMYWFMFSTLEDQQTDVKGHLKISLFWPSPNEISKLGVIVTNEGSSAIGERHALRCEANRITLQNGLGFEDLSLGNSPSRTAPIEANGDSEICADITAVFTYSLRTQPAFFDEKKYRFTGRVEGHQFVWTPQRIDYPGKYCDESPVTQRPVPLQ